MIHYICIFILLIRNTHGIIYRINDTEYEKMPPILHMDEYENCFYDPNALYCTSEFKLVSDTHSDLLNLIRNYSERTLTHYDHTKLYYGICVTRSCNISKEETLRNLNESLEGCLNYTTWQKYKLKVKLSALPQCYSDDDKMEIDAGDIIVATLCLLVILLNIVATSFDIYATNESQSKGMQILMSFSILRNWKKLHNVDYRTKPQLKNLRGIDGLRAVTMIIIAFGHCFIPYACAVHNTRFFEKIYDFIPIHILFDGSIIIQCFILISGFLLSYNNQRSLEKQKQHWTSIVSGIFKRWLRLTPTFAIALAFISTWLRFMGSGPIWQVVEMKEINDCRRDWLWILTYTSNYKDDSNCMPHAWYITLDMHLHCLGLLILVLFTSSFWRNIILAITFLIGLLTPALHTYFQDLDPSLLISPELLRQLFTSDPTFQHLYKRTHTNIVSYVLGLAMGILVYSLQKNNFNIQKYKKFKVLYWAIIPFGLAFVLSCSTFYEDGPRAPLYTRVLFQMFSRPLMGVLYAVTIIGFIFKYEKPYRCFFEWAGWSWVSRVSYSVYVTHFTVLRMFIATSPTLLTMSPYVVSQVVGVVTLSFLVGIIFWLMIESPVNQIVKICFESSPKKTVKSCDKGTPDAETQVAYL